MTEKSDGTVAILLCTFNGSRFLTEQIESLSNQTWPIIDVWASDDHSVEGTPEMLIKSAGNWDKGRFVVRTGPGKGFAANFLSMACDPAIDASYFAYCDQDDTWRPGKLDKAINWLNTQPDNYPALYCSRTELIDEQGHSMGFSPKFTKIACFQNAIIQNIAGGNTMVMNRAARELILKVGQQQIISHDWWTYMLVTGCGGKVYYDPEPQVAYRQHQSNLMGHNNDTKARWSRIKLLFRGTFKNWNEINCHALQHGMPILTKENQAILKTFEYLRGKKGIVGAYNLKKSGIFRQTFLGNLGLWVAAAFGKL